MIDVRRGYAFSNMAIDLIKAAQGKASAHWRIGWVSGTKVRHL